METNETLLMAWATEGDAAAFARLAERLGPTVYRTALRLTGRAADADDVLQETLATLYAHASDLRPELSCRGWAVRIATNAARRKLRTERRRARREERYARGRDRWMEPGIPGDWPEVERHLAALPVKRRLPLVLHYLEGMSYREIAAALGCSLGSISNRVQAGLRDLRRRLAAARPSIGVVAVEELLRRMPEVPVGPAGRSLGVPTTLPATRASDLLPPVLGASAGASAGASLAIASLAVGLAALIFLGFRTLERVSAAADPAWTGEGSARAAAVAPSPVAPSPAIAPGGAAREETGDGRAAPPPSPPTSSSAAQEPRSPAGNRAATIRGTVRDPRGMPIAGAAVTLHKPGKTMAIREDARDTLRVPGGLQVGRAGEDGRFELTDVATGFRWELEASHGGYARRRVKIGRLEAGETRTVDVTLPDAYGLRVRLRTPGGSPVEGEVRYFLRNAEHGTGSGRKASIEESRLVVRDLHPGELPPEWLEVEVEVEGFAKTAVAWPSLAWQDAYWVGGTMTLRRGSSVTGTVTDERGRPVADAYVTAHRAGEPSVPPRPDRRVRTDAEGRFRLAALEDGTHRIRARSATHLLREPVEVAVADDEQVGGVSVVLDPGHTLSGVVVDPEGLPIDGVQLSVGFGFPFGEPFERAARTAGDGTFRIQGLDPGAREHRLTFLGPVGEIRDHAIVARGAYETELRIVATRYETPARPVQRLAPSVTLQLD